MPIFGRNIREQQPIAQPLDPNMQALALGASPAGANGRTQLHKIGKPELGKAVEILTRYKQGKANLEKRIVEDELWWELRHWEIIRNNSKVDAGPEPSSAWTFNAIMGKHADAMDNYPESVVLPREQSDEQSARTLSQVLPVVFEYNDFEQVYSENWWEKLKHGTGAYGVFWDTKKENGLGDISIQQIDLLKLFWEPGITDIQKSRNLFIVDLVDEELLDAQYPEHAGHMGGSVVDVKQYIYDDTVDTTGKSVVVDWYYKVTSPSGRTILHFAKFVGDTLLYATENDPDRMDTGLYDDGLYPVVLDVMFPEKGTPVGFGYVAICKDPQLYIDKLSANILESSMMNTKKRWFASTSTNINKQQLLDWSEPIVDVEGDIDERRLREMTTQPLDGINVNVLQMKIEEMKETAANRDVSNGSAGSGVTAAAAIAALQEASNKASRDMIGASYRAHVAICSMAINRMAQFYDETRTFRITGQTPGDYTFIGLNNAQLGEQQIGTDERGAAIYRRPVFDLKVKAQKKNPFSRMEQNERAKELYSMGFFNPQRAQEALLALEMMDFEGIDAVREKVAQGETLLNICQRMGAQLDQMASIVQAVTGVDMGAAVLGGAPAVGGAGGGSTAAPVQNSDGNSLASAVMQAQTPMTDYGSRLAQRAVPNMTQVTSKATPK